jgi:hypothetical protein
MTISEKACCICDQSFVGHGHNPDPFDGEIGQCCDDCNDRWVVPVRILFGRGGSTAPLQLFKRMAAMGASCAVNTKAAHEWLEAERAKIAAGT